MWAGVILAAVAGWTLGVWAWLAVAVGWGVLLGVRTIRRTKPGWVYFIQAKGTGHIKVGMTYDDPANRMRSLQTGSSLPLTLLYAHPCDNPRQVETWLHETLEEFRVGGEWFEADPTMGAMMLLQVGGSEPPPFSKVYRKER